MNLYHFSPESIGVSKPASPIRGTVATVQLCAKPPKKNNLPNSHQISPFSPLSDQIGCNQYGVQGESLKKIELAKN